ncbi:hypothetical protein OROMI_028661 [Orobanche minor]
MSSKRERKPSKHIRNPIRVLARAWDSYQKSMTGFGGPITYGNTMGCPIPHFSSVDSNYRPTDEESKLATARRLTGKLDTAGFHRSKSVVPLGGKTAAFGRIDEDSEF